MTDTDIFSLWTRADAIEKAGKWPDGAPELRLRYSRLTKHGSWMVKVGDAESATLSSNDTDAALWRIMQFVAWATQRKMKRTEFYHNMYLKSRVNGDGWFKATPDDWIIEAAAILTHLESKP